MKILDYLKGIATEKESFDYPSEEKVYVLKDGRLVEMEDEVDDNN